MLLPAPRLRRPALLLALVALAAGAAVVGLAPADPRAASGVSERIRGSAPLVVQFEDDSTGPATSWSWDFGDGTSSSVRHPLHTYSRPGAYTARLRVTGPGGADVREKSQVVVVDPRPSCPPPTDTGFTTYADVPYGAEGDCSQRRCLDVYVPNQPRACSPTLVYLHGGGWSEGSKADPSTRALAEVLAAEGWFVVSVNYPLSTFLPCDGVVGASTYPGVVSDCKTALDWVHAKGTQQFGLADRVVLIGSSAGAHLAALLATTLGPEEGYFDPDPAGDYRVDRAFLFAPVANLVKIGCEGNPWLDPCPSLCPGSPPPDCRFQQGCLHTGGFPPGFPCAGEGVNCRHFDAPEALVGELWLSGTVPPGVDCSNPLRLPPTLPGLPTGNPWYDASPIFWVGGDEPPIHLFTAVCDALVPSYETTDFAARLAELGVPVQLQLEAPVQTCDPGCRHAIFGVYGVLAGAELISALLVSEFGG